MPRSPKSGALALPEDYPQLLTEIKRRVTAAQTRAALAVNSELIALYWDIGREILARERREGWGAKVIERLAAALRRAFPDIRGLSARNLRYMRDLAGAHGRPRAPARFCNNLLPNCPGATIRCSWTRRQTPPRAHGTRPPRSKTDGRAGAPGSDRERPSQAPWQRADDLRPCPAGARFGARARCPEGPLQLRLPGPLRARPRARPRARAARRRAVLPRRDGSRLCARRPPVPAARDRQGDRPRAGVLRGPALLQLRPPALRRDRPQDRGLQAGVRRQDELLPHRRDQLERQPGDEPSIGLVLCPGRSRTVTKWALRGLDVPIAVARYTAGGLTLTDRPPAELGRALPELPQLASGLSEVVEAARGGAQRGECRKSSGDIVEISAGRM